MDELSRKKSVVFSVPGVKGGLFVVTIFSLVANLLMLTVPIYSLQLFDRVLSSRSTETLLLLTLAAVIAVTVYSFMDIVRIGILKKISNRIEIYHSQNIVELSLLKSAREGIATAQPLRDLTEIKNAVSSPVTLAIFDIPWMPVFLFATFLIHPWVGYLTLSGIAVLLTVAFLHGYFLNRSAKKIGEKQISTLEEMQDFADNADSIIAMGIRDNVAVRWQRYVLSTLSEDSLAAKISGTLQNISKFLRILLQIAVMGLGCYLVLKLQMTAGGMIASSILMARALAPADQAISSWRLISSASQAAERLRKLLKDDAPKRPSVPARMANGKLEVSQLTYSLPSSASPILKGLNFVLEPGTVTGLIGPSGSGKSTVAKLLVGVLEPTLGSVRLDRIEVTKRAMFDLGSFIGYLPQDVQLFRGSIKDNISRLQEASPSEIRAAADLADVTSLINEMPNGFDTEIGPGNLELSGGEKQRLGLARALFGNPKLVVLDEPDANLDPEGIEKLIAVLQSLRENKVTVLIISHRPSLLQQLDRLIVLRDGKVEQYGPANDILDYFGSGERKTNQLADQSKHKKNVTARPFRRPDRIRGAI